MWFRVFVNCERRSGMMQFWLDSGTLSRHISSCGTIRVQIFCISMKIFLNVQVFFGLHVLSAFSHCVLHYF